MVISPAFSKVNVSSMYCPAVSPSSRSVRVTASSSPSMYVAESPGISMPSADPLPVEPSSNSTSPKPSPLTSVRVSASSPALTTASWSSASSPCS
jgi:hypothetical protein